MSQCFYAKGNEPALCVYAPTYTVQVCIKQRNKHTSLRISFCVDGQLQALPLLRVCVQVYSGHHRWIDIDG